MTKIYISIYCDIAHQNIFFFKYPFRSFIEETLHWIYLPSACILIILLRFLRTAENVNEMVRVWPFDHLGFELPNLLLRVGEDGKTFGTDPLQLQKDPPHINSPQTSTLLQGWQVLLAVFPRSDIGNSKRGYLLYFLWPPPALCFAINSRYEGRANKTSIVRAIRAITPDKPLPKCSSASSKSNQIIKQQNLNFTSSVQPRFWRKNIWAKSHFLHCVVYMLFRRQKEWFQWIKINIPS